MKLTTWKLRVKLSIVNLRLIHWLPAINYSASPNLYDARLACSKFGAANDYSTRQEEEVREGRR